MKKILSIDDEPRSPRFADPLVLDRRMVVAACYRISLALLTT